MIKHKTIGRVQDSGYRKSVKEMLFESRKIEVMITDTTLPGIEIWRRFNTEYGHVWNMWCFMHYDEHNRKWKYVQYEQQPIRELLDNPLDANKFMNRKKPLLTTEMIEKLEAYTVAYKLNRRSGKGYNDLSLQGKIWTPPILYCKKENIKQMSVEPIKFSVVKSRREIDGIR
jgi:hypothetical protein